MKRLLTAALAALTLLLPAAGCGDSAGPSASDDTFTVLTSFAPIYALTCNVADGVPGVEVVNMAASGTGCLHDYQLTTADMRKVEAADVFVINGGGMESFMDKVFSADRDKTVIDTSEGVTLLESGGAGEDGDHDHDHAQNPHIWLSVRNAMQQVRNIRDGLKETDPDHAADYERNAAAFLEQLEALDAEYTEGLRNVRTRDIMTFHEAFDYLAHDYGLRVVAVVTAEPGVSPDPKTLQGLIDTVKEKKITAIFDEPQYDNATARLIAENTGAKQYTLDPLVTGEMTKDSYLRVMRENLDTLRQALA